jgi:hypothetical protein
MVSQNGFKNPDISKTRVDHQEKYWPSQNSNTQ